MDLERMSGVKEPTLAQIEAGAIDPQWGVVEDIANVLGTTLSKLAEAVSEQRQDPQPERSRSG